MKAKIVLSVATMPDKVRDSVVAELLVLNMSANVTPIVSVLRSDIDIERAKVEYGVSVDILEVDHGTDILRLWKRLRGVLKINCFWLEVDEPLDENGLHPYKGCVCEWPVYLANTEIVGPHIIIGTKSGGKDDPRSWENRIPF